MAFRFDVKLDARQLVARTSKERRRLALSISKGSNDTAVEIQKAERAQLDRKFVVRRAGFMYRLIKVLFSNVKRGVAVAEVYLDRTKRRVLLPFFEQGGVKDPLEGRKTVAVPITGGPARPSFRGLIRPAYEYTKLRLTPLRPGKRGRKRESAAEFASAGVIRKGKLRTFFLPHTRRAPLGGVFQRVGPKRSDIVQVYELVRRAQLKARLGFVEVARGVWNNRFRVNFERAMRRFQS